MKSSRTNLLAGGALVLAALAAYHNSLDVPFIFDDGPSILGNPSIRHLWPLSGPLSPPDGSGGVSGRPLVNLSLAVNYALGGFEVRGYHVMNLALHALAGLTLWGVLRRTLRQPGLHPDLGDNAEPAAWVMALLWTVHPLLTESVVCIVQRTEVLGGLFYLLTFHCFIRALEGGPRERGWQGLTVAVCLLGMAAKEIVATAPVLALLYDRTFVSGTFRAAWVRRKWLYVSMAATWLLLAWLMLHNQQRGRTVGFGLGVSSWEYLLTQCEALVMYLKLSFWPHPLVVDYGTVLVGGIGEVWWQGTLIVALLLGTVAALVRQPKPGFLGAWFFVILAPSSSFVPLTTQTMAEHRMYLPLMAVIALVVGSATVWLGRRAVMGFLVLAIGAGGLTIRRNTDYQDDLTLWRDTVEKSPANSRAHAGLGTAHHDRGNLAEARRHYEESLRLDPASGHKHYNLGLVLDNLGRTDEAIRYYRETLRLMPQHAGAHANLAVILVQRGQSAEAVPHLEAALVQMPDLTGAYHTLGQALTDLGRLPEAAKAYEQALKLNPRYVEARLNLGILLARLDRLDEARKQLREAVRLRPDVAEAHANLGIVLAETGELEAAAACYREALRLRPGYAKAHYNLGNAFIGLQRWSEAKAEFEAAVREQPDFTEAREMLGKLQETGTP